MGQNKIEVTENTTGWVIFLFLQCQFARMAYSIEKLNKKFLRQLLLVNVIKLLKSLYPTVFSLCIDSM
jgi:hypothetical protein